jgi:uncharacterized protein YjbI with pentapeptide repeats
MPNREHFEFLNRGIKEWNQWRSANPNIKPDLIGAYLVGVNLCGANLNETELGAANLTNADLSGANLSGTDLSETDLSEADLTGANLTGAKLNQANLTKADLRRAKLSMAKLIGAKLIEAKLIEANFFVARLNRADLSRAKLSGANLQDASLKASRLINANFDGANLTGARLWETQRAGWSIKGVICESVYWDRAEKKLDTYEPGEFERLFSEKARVQIKYPGGISTLEITTLPGLIQHLEALHIGTSLRFESIQDASGGAIVNLVFDNAGDISPEHIEKIRTEIQAEADQKALFLRQALEGEKQTVLLLKGEVQALERTVDKLLLNQKPTVYLGKGDLNMSGDTYNIPGQAGAVGPNAHTHDNTFNQPQQIGRRTEQSTDLAALATELETLRQALKKEAVTEEHDLAIVDIGTAKRAAEAKDSGKLAESLKSAGKWALDVATKIGVSLATEAIKQSTGLK